MNWSVLIEVLIASGFFAGVPQLIRWVRTHRKSDEQRATEREELSAAKVIQGISVDLLKPLHDQLDEANRQVRELREETGELRVELRTARAECDAIVRWAGQALNVIEQHHLAVPAPLPPQIRRIH